MSLLRGALWLGVAVAIAAPRWALAEGRTLRHDPFARPSFGGLPQRAAPAGRPATPAPVDPKRLLNVHAVMVAGAASIANIDGVMVRVGDYVQGYQLVEVDERGAVFEKNKAQFKVPLRGTKESK
jgi:hypothetical protein